MEQTELKTTLVGQVDEFLSRFIYLPNEAARLIVSLFVIHSWAIEAASATPYIYLHSPEKQSGKTRVLECLSVVVRNPLMGASVTDAVLFRMIETYQPTLLLDEIDTIFSGSKNESLRGVLNSGYRRSGHIWRVQKNEPYRFKTFSAKVLAGINNLNLPDTIKDRSIPIRMRRKPRGVSVEPFYMDDIRESGELEKLLSRIERWVDTHGESLTMVRPEPIEGISDRRWEITEPLVAIAQKMGVEQEARDAIITLFNEVEAEEGISEQAELLISIKEIFEGRQRVTTAEILERLGRDWNGKMLANRLSPYGVQPKLLRIGNEIARGYEKAQFIETWNSYL